MLLDSLRQDVRIGLRVLIKERGFCALAVFVIALGICGVTTMFSVVNGTMLRGFSFPNADRLASIRFIDPSQSNFFGVANQIFALDYQEMRAGQKSFDHIAPYISGSTVNVTHEGTPRRYTGAYVTESFLKILGVAPVLGRDFSAADNTPGAEKVALVSHKLWQRDFGARRDVVGQAVRLNGKPATIVGVMPAGFAFPLNEEIWIPLFGEFPPRLRTDRTGAANAPVVIGLLRREVTFEQATLEVTGFASRLAQEFAETNKNFATGLVQPLIKAFVPQALRGLLLSMLAVCVAVLLLACANVMNMQFARAALRAKELAIRSSLGATRGRLVRQMLTESLLLAALGATLGTLLSFYASDWLLASARNLANPIPAFISFDIDRVVLGFVVGATVISAVASGVLPAWMASSAHPVEVLKESGRGHTSRAVALVTRGLVVFQILLTCVILLASLLQLKFLNSFLLRPLPHGDASRLLVVYEQSIKGGRENFSRVTYGNVIGVQERTGAFSRSGVFRNESATFQNGDATETAFIQRVTADVFPLMGARAALGSVITRANTEVGGIRSIVLSDSLWRRRFGADTAIVGRTIQLDAQPHHVVGVMPGDFVVPTADDSPQAWAALLRTDYMPNERTQRRHHLWAELAPGRSIAHAQSELTALAATLRAEHPKENADRALFAVPLRENLLGGFGRQLLLLQGAVGLVLVVACFNCLCLLIARAIQRRREFAVRLALGAARRHLLAQLFAESLWLSLPAAALALGLAALALPHGIEFFPVNAQPTLRSLPTPTLDFTVAAVVVGAALVIALAFSAVPLLQTRRLNLESTLREGGRSAGSPGAARAARFLAAGQIAVALALLISAALLLRSQRNLAQLAPGFPLAEFDQFRVGLRGDTYRDPLKRLQFFERLRDNLRALPGVRDVGVASFIFTQPPIGYQGWVQEGDGLQMAESPKRALPCFVLPEIFRALSLRLVEGRFLDEDDTAGRPSVTVINAALAAKYFPGQSALGKRIRLEGPRTEWIEIVGVVSDVLGTGNQPAVVDTCYLTISQWPPPGLGISFLVRHGGVAPDARALERALAQIDPNMQFFGHVAPAEIYSRAAWQTHFVSRLVAGFALLAVVLAFAGIYAVNSFFVARRLGEFGIRVALGATAENILGLVLRDSLRLTLAGLAAGAMLAFAASRGLATLLYNVPALDMAVYLAAAAAMMLAGLAATLLPARRAAKVDPLTALRAE